MVLEGFDLYKTCTNPALNLHQSLEAPFGAFGASILPVWSLHSVRLEPLSDPLRCRLGAGFGAGKNDGFIRSYRGFTKIGASLKEKEDVHRHTLS